MLTKRAERMAAVVRRADVAPDIWLGVSVENGDSTRRIDCLRRVPATVRFLSIEPRLGPLRNLDLTGIHWVSVGGRSGAGRV